MPSLVASTETELPFRFITLHAPGEDLQGIQIEEALVEVEKQDDKLEIQLSSAGEQGILKAITEK